MFHHLITNDLLNLYIFIYLLYSFIAWSLLLFLNLQTVNDHMLQWCCSVALKYPVADYLPSRILILWEDLYCTLLTTGTFLLSLAICCPTCFLTNSMISGHKDFTGSWLWNPHLNGSAPIATFHHFWWCHGVCFPLLSSWPSSISVLKWALPCNHCCQEDSLPCPQSHSYALLLNYTG